MICLTAQVRHLSTWHQCCLTKAHSLLFTVPHPQLRITVIFLFCILVLYSEFILFWCFWIRYIFLRRCCGAWISPSGINKALPYLTFYCICHAHVGAVGRFHTVTGSGCAPALILASLSLQLFLQWEKRHRVLSGWVKRLEKILVCIEYFSESVHLLASDFVLSLGFAWMQMSLCVCLWGGCLGPTSPTELNICICGSWVM